MPTKMPAKSAEQDAAIINAQNAYDDAIVAFMTTAEAYARRTPHTTLEMLITAANTMTAAHYTFQLMCGPDYKNAPPVSVSDL